MTPHTHTFKHTHTHTFKHTRTHTHTHTHTQFTHSNTRTHTHNSHSQGKRLLEPDAGEQYLVLGRQMKTAGNGCFAAMEFENALMRCV